MKAIALGNKLARDLDEKSFIDLTADVRTEILDAINGGLQTLHALAPAHSKITTGSISLEAPVTVALGVTHGSAEITGYAFSLDQRYRTLRITGDEIDNQVAGSDELLHPYAGATGTVDATIYADGVALPEPYSELVGDPTVLETGRSLTHYRHTIQHRQRVTSWHRKLVAEPECYWLEANAANQNSSAPAVIRFDRLPERMYRLQGQFMLAPARVSFSDLLTPGAEIPLRAELVEVYLLPIARGILTASRLWRDKESKSQARTDSAAAERNYAAYVPQTLATPRGRVGTPRGY